MSGFLDTITRTLSGLVNDAADATKDPSRDARQIIREMETQITDVENAMLNVKAEHEMLKQKKTTHEAEVTKWTNAATKAVSAGQDDLARECLGKKATAKKSLDAVSTSLVSFDATVKEMTDKLADLRAKKDDMESRKDMIAARSIMAEAQETAATVISGIGGNSAAADFDQLEDDVAKKEARAKAAMGMANDANGNDLENRVAALGNTSIDDELAAMKAAANK